MTNKSLIEGLWISSCTNKENKNENNKREKLFYHNPNVNKYNTVYFTYWIINVNLKFKILYFKCD